MNFLVKILISGLAVLITAYLLPGVDVDGMLGAVIVAAVLAVLDAIIKPLMIILTLPVTIVTLGLFLLVINAFVILLASKIVPGFKVDGFWWALLFSIILSIISSVFEGMAKNNK
ncbi:MAG: phage holin family protein [Chitinophagaceae bacterium]|nr:phage holin family protein [Chitinophagaceae bacterium]